MAKLDISNWSQLDFLINNFYEIVEYKRGRGVYGDRAILKRYKDPKAIFGEPQKLCEFFYLDAHAVKEHPLTIKLRVENIIRLVTSPENMNILCDTESDIDPTMWAGETKNILNNAMENGVDYKELNDIIMSQYMKLPNEFRSRLQQHRQKQYTIAVGLELIDEDHARSELHREDNPDRF